MIDHDKRAIAAFAGDVERAHEAGCAFLAGHCRVRPAMADLILTTNGGYPLDQNLYQAVKGMTAGEAACREGGVIIIAASCSDGHGGESFYRNLAEAASPEELLARVAAVPRGRTEPDQWGFQILAEALSMAYALLGPEAKVAAIPDGVSVIVNPSRCL